MVNINLLKSEIVKKGHTLCSFCKEIGMPQSTFTRRMQQGIFKTDEVCRIMKVLNLDTPQEIFFASSLTCEVKENAGGQYER